MVQNAAKEATIKICYAPGISKPISVDVISDKPPLLTVEDFFCFDNMHTKIDKAVLNYDLQELGTFYNSMFTSIKQN
jgi:hypothetical protein